MLSSPFALLCSGLILCAFAPSALANDTLLPSEARWLAPGADIAAALSRSPGECLRAAESADERYLIEAGRAAFKSPLLLGGPAARNALSCNSCHRNGAGNPAFFLEGLSDRPGSADVTSSLFSKSREDGVFNPVAIPTLVGAGGKAAFGTVSPKPSLHAFIGSAIGEEFQGAPPPEAILAGLAAYVAHLDTKACPLKPQRETVRGAMRDVDRGLAVAGTALEKGDAPAADFLLLSAQRALRPVNDRYGGAGLADERAKIEELARRIGSIRPLVVAAPEEALARIETARAEAGRLSDRLHKKRKASLYNLQVLRRAVEGAPSE